MPRPGGSRGSRSRATQIRHFRANRARGEDARWLAELLSREGRAFGTRVELQPDGTLALRWGGDRADAGLIFRNDSRVRAAMVERVRYFRGAGMLKILLAVDGSESAVRAARKLIETAGWYKAPPTVELVAVHLPVPLVGFADVVVSREMTERYYREEGEKMLAAARQLLDAAGIRYTPHILVGQIAQTIVAHAHGSGCHMIYMGTRGMTALSNVVMGSTATKVLHLADVPVVLVH